MKLTKTLDVSEVPDLTLKRLDSLLALTEDQVRLVLIDGANIKRIEQQRDDMKVVVKRAIHLLRHPMEMGAFGSERQIADSIEKVMRDKGIEL